MTNSNKQNVFWLDSLSLFIFTCNIFEKSEIIYILLKLEIKNNIYTNKRLHRFAYPIFTVKVRVYKMLYRINNDAFYLFPALLQLQNFILLSHEEKKIYIFSCPIT